MLEAVLGVLSFLAELLGLLFDPPRIFYWPGWLVLKVLTLGRYPPAQGEESSRDFVALVGFYSVVVALIMLPFLV